MSRAAGAGATTLTAALATTLAAAAVAATNGFAPPLGQPTALAGEVILRGELRSSLDGSTFDAITEHDRYPGLSGPPAPRLGGLYDPDAGGLRVIEQDPDRHVYRLAATGAPGRACLEAGVASPCLAPRLEALAHERLVTAGDFAATLAGRLDADLVPGPTLPPVTNAEAAAGGWLGSLAALLGAAALARAVRRARRDSAMGQVRAAAAEARRAVRGQATLARARDQIQALSARAEELEIARRACAARLATLDPARLETRRAAWARSPAPDAGAALAALTTEAGEARQLAIDLSSAVAGLDRIASSLRALALRAREDRGLRAVASHGDPVEALSGELDLRDAAVAEAEHAGLVGIARSERDY